MNQFSKGSKRSCNWEKVAIHPRCTNGKITVLLLAIYRWIGNISNSIQVWFYYDCCDKFIEGGREGGVAFFSEVFLPLANHKHISNHKPQWHGRASGFKIMFHIRTVMMSRQFAKLTTIIWMKRIIVKKNKTSLKLEFDRPLFSNLNVCEFDFQSWSSRIS